MNGTQVQADESRGSFSLDTTVPRADFATFQREWGAQIGDGFPLPGFSPATTSQFLVKARAARVQEVAITDVLGTSAIQTSGALGRMEDQVRLWVIERGAWTIGGPLDRSQHTVPAGQFLLRHVGRPSHFQTAPHTIARVLVLPAAMLKPLLWNRSLTGPASSAEVRLLMAHANMIHKSVTSLGVAGVHAVSSSMIELAKAVALGRFDDTEPRLAPVLTQAAKDLANRRLADPGLSSAAIARELNVSVRTLQRAFAATGEPVTAYVRRRRLEEARLALTAPSGRPSVSEVAAYWQFADSSHFIHAFKKQFGQTPTEYARAVSRSCRAARP